QTTLSTTSDVTISPLVACTAPIIWEGSFFTGETSPKQFQVNASLQFNGQTIATTNRSGNLNSSEAIVFNIDPVPGIGGTYKIVYEYRKKICIKINKVDVCLFWGATQTKESKAIIIPSGVVGQWSYFPTIKNICSNNYASGAFDVKFCRYNTVEFQVAGALYTHTENVSPFLSGTSTFNFNQIASELGINLVPGNTYNLIVCAKARAGNLFIGGEVCRNMRFNYNCCSSIPNGNITVTSVGDRCVGGSFNVIVTNPEVGVNYSFSTTAPGLTLTQVSNTSANVSTSFYTPAGPVAITTTASSCAGTQNKLSFFDLYPPSSPQCGIFQRLAEENQPIDPQVFPNPMNGKAVMRFELAETDQVELSLLNSVGQIVATPLAGQKLNAGPQEITIRREALSAGLYFYRLRVGNEVFTGKILME
ncbi:MAG: T9SS type A sorting domain-containing protein, partial [Bacteroidota bacterium]